MTINAILGLLHFYRLPMSSEPKLSNCNRSTFLNQFYLPDDVNLNELLSLSLEPNGADEC